MLHISLKTEKSFIAHPSRLLCVVGLEEYSAQDWRAATPGTARSSNLARVGPVIRAMGRIWRLGDLLSTVLICISELGSHNGLSPVWRQAIWANADLFSIKPIGTKLKWNFNQNKASVDRGPPLGVKSKQGTSEVLHWVLNQNKAPVRSPTGC